MKKYYLYSRESFQYPKNLKCGITFTDSIDYLLFCLNKNKDK